MIRNSKGFVLIETLIATVFAIGIVTLLYVSITPMISEYDDMTRRNSNIDIVYKLFHIRKMLYKENVKLENDEKITCESLSNKDYCETLLNYLELTNYNLYYFHDNTKRTNNMPFDEEVKTYLNKYQNDKDFLLLEDANNHLIVHLKYK